MKRIARFSLNRANTNKKNLLYDLYKEYVDGVNLYLNILSSQHKYILTNQEVKENNNTLPERYKQCAYNQAVLIWKVWRRNKKKGELPIYKGCLNLDKRFIKVEKSEGSFDYVVRISTLRKGRRTVIPFKSYNYANEYFENWKLCNGGKIEFKDNGIFLILTFEKETPKIKKEGNIIGVDIGIKKLMADSEGNEYGKGIESKLDKIQRKEQSSKAFKRALRERDEYINRIVKELPYEEAKAIVMEDIKNIKKNTKKEKKLGKNFRSKFQRWTYAKLFSRVDQLCELNGVRFSQVDPAYTSQTCFVCGFVHKSNRKGESFECKDCGYSSDADFNASRNILKNYLAQENMIPGNMKGDLRIYL